MWFFEVKDFPAIVTMDSLGNSVHKNIEELSLQELKKLIGP
jgi:tartrate dehydratase beta subunit/fumarate hydratase class I family protein